MDEKTKSEKSEYITDELIKRIKVLFSKYKYALLILLILAALGQIAIQFMLYKLKSDATLINLAGRQRMLGQEITKNLILSTTIKINDQELQLKIKSSKSVWLKTHKDIGFSKELGDIDFK